MNKQLHPLRHVVEPKLNTDARALSGVELPLELSHLYSVQCRIQCRHTMAIVNEKIMLNSDRDCTNTLYIPQIMAFFYY
jgi:hypothetical protein